MHYIQEIFKKIVSFDIKFFIYSFILFDLYLTLFIQVEEYFFGVVNSSGISYSSVSSFSFKLLCKTFVISSTSLFEYDIALIFSLSDVALVSITIYSDTMLRLI